MWKACIVIAFILTIFFVVKTFQMSDADPECCLSSYTSLSAMRYFSLLSNKTLYIKQWISNVTMDHCMDF